ncbi:MAG: murein L,D-transpeptidase [Anaerolineae bacterium]|nr:MAG: murein L,D-transpeptidase [Anaerolineae bacterium]
MKSDSLSRREFLKLLGGGGLAWATRPLRALMEGLSPYQQGRVLYDQIAVFDRPSFQGEVLRHYWKDALVPISEVTIGDEEPAYNRVWYRLGDEGYAHSGGIQPVQTLLQFPVTEIPPEGQLAELTVPYSDARDDLGFWYEIVYRLYYLTTHWVVGYDVALDGTPVYKIRDDKWEKEYYVPARHLRLIPPEELTPLSPDVPPEAKRIEVRTDEQLVIAYEYEQPVFFARAATGAEFSNGRFFTPAGTHTVLRKMPSRHMAAGNLAYNGYDLPGVPWVSYITERGVAFHGTYWHNDYGRPRSHGCINLTPQDAKWIYRWTLPVVPPDQPQAYARQDGTRVDVI